MVDPTPPAPPSEVVARLTKPISMQDVRLAAGEGRLSAADVLAGCNAELARRAAHWRSAAAIPSPSDDQVEKVARALARHNYPGGSEHYIDEMWDCWVGEARAAIAAMQPEGWVLVPRVPTNEMCVAGWKFADTRGAVLGNGEIAMLWSAMISASSCKDNGNGR